VLTFGSNALDLDSLELRVGTMPYHLTAMEADLLQYLLQNAGKVVSRKAILEDVWNVHEDTDTRAIDNFIVRLRRFLNENPTTPRHVLTVRGIGYKFIADPDQ
jgi:DNA-binding response OmpR family regulator